MKTWLGLLSATFCCCAAMADDAVLELSKHLGRTPALVVVVCDGTGRDWTRLVDDWWARRANQLDDSLPRHRALGDGQDSRLGARERFAGSARLCRGWPG